MSRNLVLLIASACGAGSVAAALDLPADADHDGRISPAEFEASGARQVLSADLDRDGRVSSLEWARQAGRVDNALATRGYPSLGQGGQAPIFPRVDTNGDGQLDPREIAAALRERFAELDANRDGFVAGSEARDLIAARR